MESARSALLAHRTGRVRWDRLGRVALLFVLAGVLALYVNPARNYVATWKEANHKQEEVRRLEARNAALRARRRALRRPAAIEREARRLGMVRPGERAYVVRGLPRGP